MARSQYIYVVIPNFGKPPLETAFTVKYELINYLKWREKAQAILRKHGDFMVLRVRDNWEREKPVDITEQIRKEMKEED